MLGTDVDLLKVVSSKLGFKFKFRRETHWLNAYKNKTFSGSVASVGYGLSDIAMGHIVKAQFNHIPGKTPLR